MDKSNLNSNEEVEMGKPTNADQEGATPKYSSIVSKFQNVLLMIAKFIVSAKFLVIAGITISSSLIVEGLLCFTLCSANLRSYILSFYYILFGLLTIGTELKFKSIKLYCKILFTSSGRGFWYLFLGTIAMGTEWWSIFIAILLIGIGMLNSYVGCTPQGNTQKNKHPQSQEIEQHNGQKQERQNQDEDDVKDNSNEYDHNNVNSTDTISINVKDDDNENDNIELGKLNKQDQDEQNIFAEDY